jgi:hypothetical protein
VFLDPDSALVRALGLEYLPAFVHLRQDTTLVAAAEGWEVAAWQTIATELARAMSWTHPQLSTAGGPPPTPGWAAIPA